MRSGALLFAWQQHSAADVTPPRKVLFQGDRLYSRPLCAHVVRSPHLGAQKNLPELFSWYWTMASRSACGRCGSQCPPLRSRCSLRRKSPGCDTKKPSRVGRRFRGTGCPMASRRGLAPAASLRDRLCESPHLRSLCSLRRTRGSQSPGCDTKKPPRVGRRFRGTGCPMASRRGLAPAASLRDRLCESPHLRSRCSLRRTRGFQSPVATQKNLPEWGGVFVVLDAQWHPVGDWRLRRRCAIDSASRPLCAHFVRYVEPVGSNPLVATQKNLPEWGGDFVVLDAQWHPVGDWRLRRRCAIDSASRPICAHFVRYVEPVGSNPLVATQKNLPEWGGVFVVLDAQWHPVGDSNPCCRDENPVS